MTYTRTLTNTAFYLFLLFITFQTANANELFEVPVGISPVMSSSAMFIAKERGYFLGK